MKKLTASLVLFVFAVSLFATAKPAKTAKSKERVILKGAFTIETPAKPSKTLIGKEWVKGWGLAGRGGVENGKVVMNSGVIYGSYMLRMLVPYKLILTIKAAAKPNAKNAVLNGSFSSCVREPGNAKRFGHEKKTPFGPFALTGEEKEYKIEYDMAKYERGYIYVGGKDVILSSIRVVGIIGGK